MLVWFLAGCVAGVTPAETADTGASIEPPPVTSPVTPGVVEGWDRLEIPVDGIYPEVTDLAITTDGALCLVGTRRTVDAPTEWTPSLPTFVVRITADGALDTAFGDQGWLVLEGSGPVEAVAPGPDGSCWVMARGDLDGVPDDVGPATFARIEADGTVSTVAEHPEGVVQELVTGPDGTMFAMGYASGAWVRRYGADGALDRSYGVNGAAVLPIDCEGSTFCSWGTVRRLPDGGAIAAGFHPTVVTRLDPDGAIDPSYGAAGAVTSARLLRVTAAALSDDGGFTLVGSPYDDALALTVPAIEPIDPDGTLLPTEFMPVDGWAFDLLDAERDLAGDLWAVGHVSSAEGSGAALVRLGEGGAGEPIVLPSPGPAVLSVVRVAANGALVAAGSDGDANLIVLTELP